MKKFIFIPVIVFGTFLMLRCCYTYLSLSEGAKLAEIPYEPYYPPPPHDPDVEPCQCLDPEPPIITIYYSQPYTPPVEKYRRPETVSDLRDGGENRIPNDDRKRR
jgi:hypothetical protein